MRSIYCGAALLALALPSTAVQKKRLTLEQTMGPAAAKVDLSGELEEWAWASDGRHLVRGEDTEARWIDPVTWKEQAPEADAKAAEREALIKAFAGVAGVDEARAKELASSRVDSSEDESTTLFADGGELWIHRKWDSPRRIPGVPEGAELADLSPDGRHIAYVADNDLFVVDTAGGKLRALTTTGDSENFNGKLDWVYQEEIYGRGDFKAFWWSPDSTRIAFLYLDEAPVHEFTVVDHIEPGHFRGKPEVTNYPKAGDPNPNVRLAVAEVATGGITWVDLARYAESEPLVVRVDWSPDSSQVLFQVQDRIQTWLDLNVADPDTGEVTTLIHETSDSWVDRGIAPRFLADGSFLWVSARTGWAHVYRYSADGQLVTEVTRGNWEVRDILRVDEERGLVWFTGSRDGAVDSNAYRVGLDGAGLMRVTQGRGRHSITFDESGELFLDRTSSLATPPEIRLCNDEGEVLRVLARSDVPALSEYEIGRWELLEIPARDGFALDAAILKPIPFDPDRSYPVWLPTYSGPDAPSVRNSWNTNLFYQLLAQQGVIVLQVNVRTASQKGHHAIEQCYKQLGVQELRDLLDAVAWLTEKPWADAARVGITGYSYGGFMTAFALTHSDAFKLGIAGGGVYHWGMYDTIYTERYMSTPELNPEGYEKTSVLAAAGDLKGHLVLTHSTMDDNVHMQNVLQLVYALQQADRSFELMLYPQNRHGVRDAAQRWFGRRQEWKAIREHLLEAGDEPPAAPEAPTGVADPASFKRA